MRMAEFIDLLGSNLGVSRERSHKTYRAFMGTVREALSRGEEVRLEGLGKFVSQLQTARQGRPQLASDSDNLIVDVSFVQFRSSRTQLLKDCPFAGELFDGQDQTIHGGEDSESAVD